LGKGLCDCGLGNCHPPALLTMQLNLSSQTSRFVQRCPITAPRRPGTGGRASAPRSVRVRAEVIEIPHGFKKASPKGDLVLIKIADAEKASMGGVLLPEKARVKPTCGDVAGLGDGRVGTQVREFFVKEGQTVLYNKFGIGATDILLDGVDYTMIREDDLIGIMPHSQATALDVPELQPLGDRILLKVLEPPDMTSGGVFLPITAKERPMVGVVVRKGPGRLEEDGTRKPVKVEPEDRVLYFKWAGDNMETPAGEKFVVVHESDVLCHI